MELDAANQVDRLHLPCHSGYWINELDAEQNRAIYTSCDWDEVGWANDDHMQSYFGINAAQAAGTVRSAPIMPKAVFRM